MRSVAQIKGVRITETLSKVDKAYKEVHNGLFKTIKDRSRPTGRFYAVDDVASVLNSSMKVVLYGLNGELICKNYSE